MTGRAIDFAPSEAPTELRANENPCSPREEENFLSLMSMQRATRDVIEKLSTLSRRATSPIDAESDAVAYHHLYKLCYRNLEKISVARLGGGRELEHATTLGEAFCSQGLRISCTRVCTCRRKRPASSTSLEISTLSAQRLNFDKFSVTTNE